MLTGRQRLNASRMSGCQFRRLQVPKPLPNLRKCRICPPFSNNYVSRIKGLWEKPDFGDLPVSINSFKLHVRVEFQHADCRWSGNIRKRLLVMDVRTYIYVLPKKSWLSAKYFLPNHQDYNEIITRPFWLTTLPPNFFGSFSTSNLFPFLGLVSILLLVSSITHQPYHWICFMWHTSAFFPIRWNSILNRVTINQFDFIPLKLCASFTTSGHCLPLFRSNIYSRSAFHSY